ncbi:SpoIIIAH-like family protein [Desulfovirgula thermocuniculi]|uniref:SpoIIIAH-like family protein n=1 Tax=Desulfovirgula thermocuniculi TaxID=348842 RepID=UPI0004041855|nr:SpoIIIAH-like family protein [Desulfovirgula thermocuniculi]
MRTVLIRKRFLLAGLWALLGLALLWAGWQGWPEAGKHRGEGDAPAAGLTQSVERPALPPEGPQAREAPDKEEIAFFVDYRLDRERARSRQVEVLREVINNPQSSAEARKAAQEKLLALSQGMAQEVEVENLIRAKGFKDAAVYLDGKGATVVVRAAHITSEEARRIAELISRSTGVPEQNVVIIPRS